MSYCGIQMEFFPLCWALRFHKVSDWKQFYVRVGPLGITLFFPYWPKEAG